MKKVKIYTPGTVVLLLGLLMTNCAGTPDKSPVQRVQDDFKKAENDTVVVYNAADQLREVRKAIGKLRASIGNGENQASIEQQTALVEQRLKIARKTANLRMEQQKVKRLSKQLDSLRTNVHKIERARMEAGLAQMDIDERVKYLDGFRVVPDDRGLALRFLGITFNSEEASLTSSAEGPINELTELLNQYPERHILIEGYTDNTGSSAYNQRLSQQRANVVRKALIVRSIDSSRVQAKGLGEKYPIANNKSKTGRMRNRRVEVVISAENGKIPERKQEEKK